jgi:hypothetical protein
MLLTIFQTIPDHRRREGRRYDLAHALLFAVLAIMSGADSYRKIEIFVTTHFKILQERFNLDWKKPPGYTTIRNIIRGTDPNALESAFRAHAQTLKNLDPASYQLVSLDGKTVKGSFDHFKDQKAIQVFSAFLTTQQIILGHEMIPDKKTNEIPVAQHLIKELGLEGCLLTLDALHCQKKRLSQPKKRTMRSSSR